MSLLNLQKIGLLKEHPQDAAEVRRLLAAAARSLADARVTSISAGTRFGAAYKAITRAALAALLAHGFRPDTNRPGYHETPVLGLPLTIDLEPARLTVIETLGRKGNLSDYTGEDIDDASVEHCIGEAERLLRDVTAWLKDRWPHLIDSRAGA